VTVEVFDAHLLISSALHDAGDAYGIVAVALIDLHFQSSLGVPGVDADDGQPQLLPAGERLPYRFTSEEDGKMLRRYWTTACQNCALKSQCTTGPERRITRWEHEHLLEAVQQRLDANPEAMRQRRETVEHPFGTMKARMGATHFLTKTLPKVAAEMALSVLAYNLTRVMNIVGIKPLIAVIAA
jgi:Transposase DDE domain